MVLRRTAKLRVMPLSGVLACIIVGFLAGVLNTIAAGGSFLTLSLLLFLGLPATAANGTNRVAVLFQNIGALWGFHRGDVLEWTWSLRASVPACAGAALGVTAAFYVPDTAFRKLLAVAMLAMTLFTLIYRAVASARPRPMSPWHPGIVAGFFAMGVYGGFLQAGVGFLSLALTSVAGIDLVRGNGIKAFVVFLLTVLSLAVFAGAGQIAWPAGVALGLGSAIGSVIGVRLAILRGQRWLEYVVSIALVIFAVVLWITP